MGKVLKGVGFWYEMVRAIMIVEMAGRPPEHLKESLEKHIKILDDVKDIEVHSIKISEPVEIKVDEVNGEKGGEPMFTAFAEADFECESFARLSETMFDFMPSSVEVVEPTKVVMDLHDATNLLNNISGRMHRYDEIAKIAGARLQQMNGQLQLAQKILAEKDEMIAKLKKEPAKKKVVKKTPLDSRGHRTGRGKLKKGVKKSSKKKK